MQETFFFLMNCFDIASVESMFGYDGSPSSLKPQPPGRHVTPLGHIILIPSQPVVCSFSLMICA
jgi:hypothetical protein